MQQAKNLAIRMTVADARRRKAEKGNTRSTGGKKMILNGKKKERKNNYFTFHFMDKRDPERRYRKSNFHVGHHKANASSAYAMIHRSGT